MTKQEREFLEELKELCKYWANLPTERIMKKLDETENEYRINGFIHSLLVMLRGESSVSDFRYYRLYKGQGKKEIGLNSYLPSAYFDIWRIDKGVKDETKKV